MKTILQTKFDDDSFYTFIRENQSMRIYYGAELMMKIDLADAREIKQAIIYFLNIEVSINWLSKTFCLARQTITQWYALYREEGMGALLNFKKGPKKITDEIRAYIIAKFKDLSFCRNYKRIICEKVEEHFRITLHWRSISEIITKSGIDLSVKRNNRKIEGLPSAGAKREKHTCAHAGLFFIYPYLIKLGIEKLFSKAREYFKNTRYHIMEYIYGLLFLLASNKIMVEENVKQHEAKRLGMVLGKRGLPSLRSYRVYLPKIIEGTDIKEFEYMLARNYYQEHASCRELYIDGHFMPYHGRYETFRGYNPIRRFAQKGRVGYFINSSEGRPFFYILSDGYKDFREYLMEIAQNVSGNTREKGNKELLLVFDRGGWGADFCEELGRRIGFVCWRRGKACVPAGLRWERVETEKKTNCYGISEKETVEAGEEVEYTADGKGVKRYIFIKRREKISLAFSNDPERNVSELVRILTRRWGVQENVFKGLKGMGIDKISSYGNESYPENWLLEEAAEREVANPQRLIIEERMAEIKGDLKKLTEEAGKLSMGVEKNTSRRIQELRDELGKKKEVIVQLRDEYEAAPKKVGITEIIQAKDIVRLNSEKKKFFDLLKVLSYNVQQDIVDTIRPYYRNERDVNMFVRQLLDREGSVEVNADKITVSFRSYRSKKKNAVLNFLIDKVNTMNIKHPILNAYMQFRCS